MGINRTREGGFSLIEVMVALIIVAIALPALLVQVMSMLDGSAALRDKTIAGWVAGNQWVQLQLQRRLHQQSLSGSAQGTSLMASQTWAWQLSAEPTTMEGLRRLTLEVGFEQREPLIRLENYLDE